MHPGLATHQRAPISPILSDPLTPVTLGTVLEPRAFACADVTSSTRVATQAVTTFDRCFLQARLTGKTLITIKDSLVPAMIDGVGFYITGSRFGSVDAPDGTHRRPREDGLRPCPLPGSPLPAQPSVILDSDIINTDGRYGAAHMDGLQLWQGGNLLVRGVKISGWWQSCIMMKTDHGPIDDVTIDGCSLSGALYFQVRVIDGGHGRPTNVTITNNVIARGTGGGTNPVNTGDDFCRVSTQTTYVRTEAERLDPTWVVFDANISPEGVELVPCGGWREPVPDPATDPPTDG